MGIYWLLQSPQEAACEACLPLGGAVLSDATMVMVGASCLHIASAPQLCQGWNNCF